MTGCFSFADKKILQSPEAIDEGSLADNFLQAAH